MAVTRERFNQGMTYDEFKKWMPNNRNRIEGYEGKVQLDPKDVAFFKDLRNPLDVLVVGADWCYDVLTNLPVLARLAKESGKLNLRIFERDENPDVRDQFLNGRYQSIPVFVFYDENFNEIGHWIERPKSVTQLRADKRREVYGTDPAFGLPDAPVDQLPEDVRARLQRTQQETREETVQWANSEVARELRELVENGLMAGAGRPLIRGNYQG
jgi:thiol-disulfide isomerase/thioredoxin